MAKELLTVVEVAEMLGVQCSTIYAALRRKLLKSVPSPSRGKTGVLRYAFRRVDALRYREQSRERERRGLAALPPGPGLIEAREALEILGCVYMTLERWARNGTLRSVSDGRTSIRWFWESAVRALAKQRAAAAVLPPGCMWLPDYARKRGVSRQDIHDLWQRGKLRGGTRIMPGCARPRVYVEVP